MNTRILQKCLDALCEKKPDISYIRGMLETLIESDGTVINTISAIKPIVIQKQSVPYIPTDEEQAEAEMARKYVGGPIGNIG